MVKYRFFLLSTLPSLIFIAILLFMFSSSGQLATLDNPSPQIGKNTGALSFYYIFRNLLFVFYVGFFLLQVLFRIKGNPQKKPSLLRLSLISIVGLTLTLFAYLITALTYDVVSMTLLLLTNPSYFRK